MADSDETKTDDILDDFDAMMLDSSASDTTESDELIDDEDAIDRLLMEDETTEIEEISEPEAAAGKAEDSFDEVDEFAEVDEFLEAEDADESTTESSVVEENLKDNDALDDFDAFADDAEELEVDDISAQTEEQSASSQPDIDAEMLLSSSDFDISTDEDDDETDASSESDEQPETNENSEDVAVKADTDDDIIAEVSVVDDAEPVQTATSEVAGKVVDEALHAQVTQLWAEMESYQQGLGSAIEQIAQAAKKQKKNNQAHEQNAKKISQFSYAALSVGAIALIFSGVVFFNSFSTQAEVTQLSEMVTDMEEILTDTVNDKNSKQQAQLLSKSVEMLEAKLAVMDRQLADLIENTASQQQQANQLNTSENSKLQEFGEQFEALNRQMSGLLNKVSKLEKTKVKRVKAKKSVVTTEWTVNLVSFKLEWYAKKKAAEFKKQGIPVEVVQAQVKNEPWYRIRVSGFKTKQEAGAYAARVKKALNLSSVWVTKK
jgi:hypothetical protein